MTDSVERRPTGRRTRRAFLGLGSNIGDRVAHLSRAVAEIPDVDAISAVYETVPVGGPCQGDYLNLVVRLQTALLPYDLLEVCREREAATERVREVHWGPRTLDVDVLWIDGETLDEPELTVPHPRMFERSFVLIPLSDVGADVVPTDFDHAAAARNDGVVRVGLLGELSGP